MFCSQEHVGREVITLPLSVQFSANVSIIWREKKTLNFDEYATRIRLDRILNLVFTIVSVTGIVGNLDVN